MKILYKNLKGAFTGQGFKIKNGRKVHSDDSGFIAGPVNILVDSKSSKVLEISKASLNAEKVIDASSLMATAAFVDSHTHTLFGGSRWNEFFMRWSGQGYAAINASGGGIRKTFRDTRELSDDQLKEKFLHDVEKMSEQGVRLLEVKSGYGETLEEELRLLKIIKDLKEQTASQFSVELMATFLGLHAIPQHTDEKTWVNSAMKLLPDLKREALADFVDSFPEQGFFSLESAREFSVTAQKLGFKLKVHADEITEVKASEMGISLGASSIDHLQKISTQALEMLSGSNTVATLLPATSFYLGIEYAPARKIVDSGARVALATDYNPGTAPNPSILFTSNLAASQMKLTPSEILCALTYNAAGALGSGHNYGILAEGYSSHFLVWDVKSQNPLEEILLSGMKPTKI